MKKEKPIYSFAEAKRHIAAIGADKDQTNRRSFVCGKNLVKKSRRSTSGRSEHLGTKSEIYSLLQRHNR